MNVRLRREVEGAQQTGPTPTAQHHNGEGRPRRTRKRRRGRAAEPTAVVVEVESATAEVEVAAGPAAAEVEAAAELAPVEIVAEVAPVVEEVAPAHADLTPAPVTTLEAALPIEVEAGESSFESEAVVEVRLSLDPPVAEAGDETSSSSGAIEVLVAPETPIGGAWLLEDDARILGDVPVRAAAAPDPEPGETLGAYLRRFRLARRISLDEVSASTRIPVRSLNLLEADDFSALPAEVFVKGFIRCYTRAVGLDNEVAMGLYEGARQQPATLEAPATPVADEASRRRVSLALVTLIVVILATLTLSILFARPRAARLERADLQQPLPAAAAAAPADLPDSPAV